VRASDCISGPTRTWNSNLRSSCARKHLNLRKQVTAHCCINILNVQTRTDVLKTSTRERGRSSENLRKRNRRGGNCLSNTILHYDKRAPLGEMMLRIRTF
jgi:hypothetical protein